MCVLRVLRVRAVACLRTEFRLSRPTRPGQIVSRASSSTTSLHHNSPPFPSHATPLTRTRTHTHTQKIQRIALYASSGFAAFRTPDDASVPSVVRPPAAQMANKFRDRPSPRGRRSSPPPSSSSTIHRTFSAMEMETGHPMSVPPATPRPASTERLQQHRYIFVLSLLLSGPILVRPGFAFRARVDALINNIVCSFSILPGILHRVQPQRQKHRRILASLHTHTHSLHNVCSTGMPCVCVCVCMFVCSYSIGR